MSLSYQKARNKKWNETESDSEITDIGAIRQKQQNDCY